MTPVNLIGAVFISMAVVIAVVGQLITIWDFFGVKRPKFQSPTIAFIGAIPFLLLLSSIVAINVVPGSNNVSTANILAQVAVGIGIIPYLLILIVVFYQASQQVAKRWLYMLKGVASLLIGGPALLLLFVVPMPLPPNGTLIVGCIFTVIPIAFGWNGWQDRPSK